MNKSKKIPLLIPCLYVLVVSVFTLTMVMIGKSIVQLKSDYNGEDYAIENVFEQTNTVINNEQIDEQTNENNESQTILTEPTVGPTTIIRPYIVDEVELSRPFYDPKADEETQQKSIIFYKGSYIQNKGSEYSSKTEFEVVSIIDGTVKSIKKDSNLGYIVTIEHEKELVTLYQYLKEVKVSEGSKIKCGEIIGISGKSILENEDGYILHMEVTYKGKNIDPESLYTMTVEDFE